MHLLRFRPARRREPAGIRLDPQKDWQRNESDRRARVFSVLECPPAGRAYRGAVNPADEDRLALVIETARALGSAAPAFGGLPPVATAFRKSVITQRRRPQLGHQSWSDPR